MVRRSPGPEFSVEPAFLCEAIDGLLKRSRLFRETGGCHSAELHGRDGFVFGHDDIGRHNAVDKVVGHAVLAGVALGDKVLAITGRMASDIVKKAAVAGIPILASKAPPTDLAVKVARSYGITIAGFVRGRRLTVYSGADRVLGGRKTAL